MKKNGKWNMFVLFWASQSVSQLGSAMTSYALIIWTYNITKSALFTSGLTFCSYFPIVIISIFAGPYIDSYKKKKIILICDTIAAAATCCLWMLLSHGMLNINKIYILSILIGFMNAFQLPASAAALGLMVPPQIYDKANGLNAFSESVITITMPVFATMLMSFIGISAVICFDLFSFLFAAFIMLFFIEIPDTKKSIQKSNYFKDIKEGFEFLKHSKGVLCLIINMSLLSFFSNITYENILSPMLLARTGGNKLILGIVNGALGLGGIIGGIYVSIRPPKGDRMKLIFIPAAISFLVGDFLMGIGNNLFVWICAGLAASIPIPIATVQQKVLMYNNVKKELQGRVFAVKNAIQYLAISIGIISGGFLADTVFEPLMKSGKIGFLNALCGCKTGSGMAVMFLMTCCLGSISCFWGYKNKNIRKLNNSYEDINRIAS